MALQLVASNQAPTISAPVRPALTLHIAPDLTSTDAYRVACANIAADEIGGGETADEIARLASAFGLSYQTVSDDVDTAIDAMRD